MNTYQIKNQHLSWRGGFGPHYNQMDIFKQQAPRAFAKEMMSSAVASPMAITVMDNALEEIYGQVMGENGKSAINANDRKLLQQKQREAIRKLNMQWLKEMVATKSQLREKMSLFWHGHFACRNQNVFFNQQLLHIIRSNSLGKFSDLLKAVSQSAAMLIFLNNQQNRKGHPNENFAREVMELFTLGRGNYTENDIKEAARAFTGWSTDKQGNFIFRKNQHDNGTKEVFGKKGNFDGNDILNLILEKRITAQYLVKKIYKYFVNGEIDNSIVDDLAKKFYESDYDIRQLMSSIFLSDWFYQVKHIGKRIKSPIELIVGIQRQLPIEIVNEDRLFQLQRLLGQQLFYPPNVAGWPGGNNWIDSSTLMVRLRVGQMMTGGERIELQPKNDDDVMMGRPIDMADTRKNANLLNLKSSVNWYIFNQQFSKTRRNDLLLELSTYLLQNANKEVEKILVSNLDTAHRDSFIKTSVVGLLSMPEYQLC